MIGISASEVEAVGVVGPADGDGATVGAADGLTDGATEAGLLGSGVGLADGGAAATVNVVVPWSRSPSAADFEVHRTV